MSQENVEIVRAGYDAFSRRDLDAALANVDPEIEWRQSTALPDARTFRGHDGVRGFFEQIFELFDRSDFVPEEITDLGDQIVVLHRFVGYGRSSGVPVEATEAALWTLRDGKAIRQQAFPTKEDALEAAGLEE